MGCGSGQKQQTQTIRLQTVNGILKVNLVSAKIQHQTSSFFAMDPYIKVKVSNQAATTKVVKKGGKQPIFNESFDFFINSCYQLNGRYLELQLWDSNKTSDSLIGYGITDLQPILSAKDQKKPKNLRIFLNYDVKPAGFVNVQIQFQQLPIQLLNFRFQTVSIRRKTSTIGDMNCYVKVTIGEQVLKTKKKKDTEQMPPVWTDDILTFNVPKVIKNCLIQVWDNKQIVGEHVFLIEDLLKDTKEKQYDEDIFFNNAIAGTLRFQTMVGDKVQFSQIKRDYKRKAPEKEKKQKQAQKGKDDKDPKKQQKGKQGQKDKQAQKQKDKQAQKQK